MVNLRDICHSLLLSAPCVIAISFGDVHPQVPLIQETHKSLLPDQTAQLLNLHKGLIDIESIVGNEYEVGQYLIKYLSAHNFSIETQIVPPLSTTTSIEEKPRLNIFAYKGETPNTRILVTSHMDTVAPYIPYARHGDEIWGRGSTDAKRMHCLTNNSR